MTPSDIQRVQTYLRRLFGTESIKIVPPMRKGLSTEVSVNDEIVGTVHKDTDDGETSFCLTLTILEEDLPPAPRVVPPAPAPRGRR
jgi:Protein of unknown function (DUF3126)